MKAFLKIHFTLWILFTFSMIMLGSVWSGFTPNYIKSIITFVLFGSHIGVLPFSSFIFLFWEFVKSKLTITIKKK